MNTTLTIDDDGVLTFPPGILEATGWKEGDVLEWIDREDGSFELRKVMSRDEFLWVEKYRPKTIEECILPEDIKKPFGDS